MCEHVYECVVHFYRKSLVFFRLNQITLELELRGHEKGSTERAFHHFSSYLLAFKINLKTSWGKKMFLYCKVLQLYQKSQNVFVQSCI